MIEFWIEQSLFVTHLQFAVVVHALIISRDSLSLRRIKSACRSHHVSTGGHHCMMESEHAAAIVHELLMSRYS